MTSPNNIHIKFDAIIDKHSISNIESIDELRNTQINLEKLLNKPPMSDDDVGKVFINDKIFFLNFLDFIIAIIIQYFKTHRQLFVQIKFVVISNVHILRLEPESDQLNFYVDGHHICNEKLRSKKVSYLRQSFLEMYKKMYDEQDLSVMFPSTSDIFSTIHCSNGNIKELLNSILLLRYEIFLPIFNEIIKPLRKILSSLDTNSLYIYHNSGNSITINGQEILFINPDDTNKYQEIYTLIKLTKYIPIPSGMILPLIQLPKINLTLCWSLFGFKIDDGDLETKYNRLKNKISNTRPFLNLYAHLEKGGSKRLNMGLLEQIITRIPLDDEKNTQFDIKKRAIQLFQAYINFIDTEISKRCDSCDHEFIVYHGTNNILHSNDTFQCMGFLSTSISLSVAMSYSTGFVYVIKIPVGFPFLHLSDTKHWQILLPLGCTIKITGTSKINDITYIECICVNDYTKEKTIMLRDELKCIGVFPPLKPDIKSFIQISQFKNIDRVNGIGSSVFHQTIKDGQKYYIKSITKASNLRRDDRGGNYILKRIVNETLSAIVYNFYGLQTFQYDILYNDFFSRKGINFGSKNILDIDIFSLGSKYNSNIQYTYDFNDLTQAKEVLSGFLVNCIVSNWDAGNNNNIGFLNEKVIYTDVGGALAYQGYGDLKIPFYGDSICTEHVTYLNPNLGTGKLFHSYLRTLEKNKIKLSTIAYETLEKIEINTILNYPPVTKLKQIILESNINQKYITFIDDILERVIFRHEYYTNNNIQIGGKPPKKILFNKKTYTLRQNKNGPFIMQKNQIIPLKNIKGKYRYMKGGDDVKQPENVKILEPSDPEIFVSPVFFDKMMTRLSESCPRNNNSSHKTHNT